MIEEQFVSFDIAKMLKEVGFDAPCYMQYSERGVQCNAFYPENFNADDWGYSCPTQALAARWLREVHKIHVSSEIMVYPVFDGVGGKEVGERISWGYYVIPTERGTPIMGNDEEFNTYESALEAGLKRGLELIKK